MNHTEIFCGGFCRQFDRCLRFRVHIIDMGFARAVVGDEHILKGWITIILVNDLLGLHHPHITGLHLLQRNTSLLILVSFRSRHGESCRVVGTITRFHTHNQTLNLILSSSLLLQRTLRHISGNIQLLPLSVVET